MGAFKPFFGIHRLHHRRRSRLLQFGCQRKEKRGASHERRTAFEILDYMQFAQLAGVSGFGACSVASSSRMVGTTQTLRSASISWPR